MGIAINAASIVLGTVCGSVFKERIQLKNFTVLAISIMMISLVGFFENIYDVRDMVLKSNDLLVVVFALIVGSFAGESMQLETRMSRLSSMTRDGFSDIMDATIFFGVGGMQICGPILLAATGDNGQLFLKSLIDFPFALMFGISYGKRVAFSAVPVAVGQLLIALVALLSESLFHASTIKQLCAMGYIILFFSGFNLICEKKNKINNVNMLVGIFVLLLYNAVSALWR